MNQKYFFTFFLILSAILLSGCNTSFDNVDKEQRQLLKALSTIDCSPEMSTAVLSDLKVDSKTKNRLNKIAVAIAQSAKGDTTHQEFLLQQAAFFRSRHLSVAEAYLNYLTGKALFGTNQKVKGIEHLLLAKEMLPAERRAAFPNAGSFFAFLGDVYCSYGDFDKALSVLHIAQGLSFCKKEDVYKLYGNIGAAYYNKGMADSALFVTQKALEIAKELKDTAEIASISGNIGAIHLLKGDYEKATYFLNKDYEISCSLLQWESATNAAIMLARSYLRQKNSALSLESLERADSIYNICSCKNNRTNREYYLILSNVYSLINHPQTAQFKDSFFYYSQVFAKESNASVLLNPELSVATRMHEIRMQLIQSERAKDLLAKNITITIILFSLIVALLLLNIQRRKRKNEERIFTLKLTNAEQQLNTFTDNLKSKNRLLAELQTELEAYTVKEANADITQIEIFEKIRCASLITEEGWEEFARLVEQVHHHFFTRLHTKIPGLNPAEVRLLTLIKLNFPIKEAAAMLGVSPDSVRKARYRIRKKLNLPEEESLEMLVEII